ncbi:MAG: C25 family cysteine peptidase, partial [Candidatus Bathyarchaeota archaeon]|nr:C25 family cysteine peptidase [Candidatus Bathyarchaeota archaeon]
MSLKKVVISFSVIVFLLIQLSYIFSPHVAFGDNTNYDLLIVAHEDFLEPLETLRDWKTRTGIPTGLVSWQTYNGYTSWGWDEPERIKNGIELAHKTYGVKYVMLVGDSDMLPVRYTYTDRKQADNTPGGQIIGYGAYYAGDLYYADLYKQDGTFDNWDYNGNHIYGELHGEWFTDDCINFDRIDMIPDVAVGRVPAASVQDVENYVDKVIDYESRTRGATRSGTTIEWFKSALFIIPYTPDDDLDEIFLGAKENIADDSLTTDRDFRITRLYDPRVSGAATITDGTPTEDLIK